MLEVYPKAVAELAPEHFGSLMATLEWGVAGSDTVAVHCSLEGLAGLAKYQHACVASGSNGLAGQSAGAATAGTSSCCRCFTYDKCGLTGCLPYTTPVCSSSCRHW
jgi:hypothetical protein